MCLPLEIRQLIFAYASTTCIKHCDFSTPIDASDILQLRQCTWLPAMCLVSDRFFIESLPMILREAGVVIREPHAAYNLNFFLQATETHAYIHTLQFTTSDAFSPSSAGAALLKNCINLRTVWLTFHVRKLFVHENVSILERTTAVPTKFDKKIFAESFAFRELLSLKKVETIALYMLRDDRWGVPHGLDDCFGMVGWLERKFKRRGVSVNVVSKSSPPINASVSRRFV